MASRRTRSTRKLRSWIVDQVNSGKYPGLIWDDEGKTMFRIPWKHAGKQDFRSDEDGAIFKAWAEYKGKLKDKEDPAAWKTRLRCALNKSEEFAEVTGRSQLDISEPYKVYRLVPMSEQQVVVPAKKMKRKPSRRQKRQSSDSSEDEEPVQVNLVKEEEVPLQLVFPKGTKLFTELFSPSQPVAFQDVPLRFDVEIEAPADEDISFLGEAVDEYQVDVRIETAPPQAQNSFHIVVSYLGQEVLRRLISSPDLRIAYQPSFPAPPTPSTLLGGGAMRVILPEPCSSLASNPDHLQALSTLLPYMEKGVVLITTPSGVYAVRYCQGRVFWVGPHGEPGLHKMERKAPPVLLFSKDIFKQKLEEYRTGVAEPPQCSITLCFGEELSETDNLSSKLITAQVEISFPWAEQEVQSAQSIAHSISILRSLASQSPLGEITLNLVPVPVNI